MQKYYSYSLQIEESCGENVEIVYNVDPIICFALFTFKLSVSNI